VPDNRWAFSRALNSQAGVSSHDRPKLLLTPQEKARQFANKVVNLLKHDAQLAPKKAESANLPALDVELRRCSGQQHPQAFRR
jgi:hypothetical protein